MSVVSQHEAVVAGAPVVARDVDAFVDAAAVVVVLTLVHVCRRGGQEVSRQDVTFQEESGRLASWLALKLPWRP